jgi:predicted DNA-binding transcriptional regulator AlpA
MNKLKEPRRVIRVRDLPEYLGVKRTQIDELIKDRVLNPFSMSPGGRANVLFADEVAQLQSERAEAARKSKGD